jgi:hypothetical protein
VKGLLQGLVSTSLGAFRGRELTPFASAVDCVLHPSREQLSANMRLLSGMLILYRLIEFTPRKTRPIQK